jgi:outer membrane lipoprotein SlyB
VTKHHKRRKQKMIRLPLIVACAAVATLAACEPQNERQANANCIVGTAGGAAVGGIAGNQVGAGTGQDLAAAAGATVGGLAGANTFCQ